MRRATFRIQIGPGASVAVRVDVARLRFGMAVALVPDAAAAPALPSPSRQLPRL